MILLTYVSMLFALYGLIATLIPELFSSITNIVSNFSNYANNIQDFATKVLANYPEMQQTAYQYISTFSAKLSNWLTNDLMPMLHTFLLNLTGQLVNMVTFFKNILLGAIVAIYMLYNKESYIAKLKKAVYALLGLEHGNAVIRDCQYVNQEFSGFLVGKVIDSIIIGAICYLVTSLISTPYALLVSVIIGVTNIIPFFGPFLGAVPCLLLILLIDPLQALYFLIFVVLLQQFDGNFLGPKILGETTGVSSFLIIISILIGGGFWGVFGMIIAVPVCAIICTVCRNFANRRLEKHHLPDDDAFYFHMDHIDPETRQAIPYQKKKIDEAEVFHFPGYRLRKALTKLTTDCFHSAQKAFSYFCFLFLDYNRAECLCRKIDTHDMSVDTQEAAGILFCAVQQDHNVASVWIDCGRYIQVCSVFAPADAFCTRSNIFGNMADVVVHDRFAVMEIIIHNQT